MTWSIPTAGWSTPSGGGTLSDVAAQGLGIANAAGTGIEASRDDHVHQRSFVRDLTNADSPYTIVAGDHTLYCNATAGVIILNAPAIAGQGSREIRVIKTDSSVNTVTYEPNAAETINGATNYALHAQYQGIVTQVDAAESGWFILDDNPLNVLWRDMDWPEGTAQGNNTILYQLMIPVDVRLLGINVYMATVNTQGTYVLTVTNQDTGNTMLVAATFNMNGLGAATLTALSLTATEVDRRLSAQNRVTIDLTSNDATFDGSGIYIALLFDEM